MSETVSPPVPPVVSAEWLREHLDDHTVRVLDATTAIERGPDGSYANGGHAAYAAGHVPGAVFADLLTDFNDPSEFMFMAPSAAKFAEAAGAAGVGAGTHVVIYDQGDEHGAPAAGVWASRLWWQFRFEGFDAVSVLDGGYRAWVAAGLPTTTQPSQVAPAEFAGVRRPELVASKGDVAGFVGDPTKLIIDSRAPEAYAGAADRPYRSGHIPSAVNLYSRAHIDAATGLLRPARELEAALRSAGALDPDRTPVVYCGGGVSATWNALALAVVGRPDAIVYDGSMLEWGADATTPLVQS